MTRRKPLTLFVVLLITLFISLSSNHNLNLKTSLETPNKMVNYSEGLLKVKGVPNEDFKSNELIITLKKNDKTGKKLKENTKNKVLINKEQVFKKLDERTFLVKFQSTKDMLLAAQNYSKNLNVESVEPNYIRKASLIPNDPYYSRQWAPAKIALPLAWNITKGSASIKVAIVDTGVDLDHPDLKGNLVAGINLVNRGQSPNDDNGHGTHVAGIVAGIINNKAGISGVAGGVKIMPIKVLDRYGGGGLDSNIAEGIRWAANNGAKVINLSLGAGYKGIAVENAIYYARSKGAVIIGAAGNENGKVGYPAALDNVIAVSATDKLDGKAKFSNYGREVDVAAPGVDIYSTIPNHKVNGYNGYNYAYESGTSMSAPHVSGIAALLLSKNPALKPYQIETIIKRSTDDKGLTGIDNTYGFGRVNAKKALDMLKTTIPSDAFEPNDTIAAAKLIKVDYQALATITTTTDKDWYLCKVTNPLVRITLEVPSNINGRIDIYNANKKLVKTVNAVGTGIKERVDLNLNAAGNYYFMISDVNKKYNLVPYKLTINELDKYENNNNIALAKTINLTQTVTANLNGGGDEDYYKIEVPQGGKISINLKTPNLIDGVITLYNGYQNHVISVDDGDYGFIEKLNYILDPGVYYIKVSDYYGYNTGESYTLSMTLDLPPTVINVSPSNNSTQVPVDANIWVTFNEDIRGGESFNKITLINDDNQSIPIYTETPGNAIYVKPNNNLPDGNKFKLVIPKGAVKDMAGNPIMFEYQLEFTTKSDGTAPQFTIASPGNNEEKVMVNRDIRITFNKNMKAGISYNNISVVDANHEAIAIDKQIINNKLIINPLEDLDNSTTYEVLIPKDSITEEFGTGLNEDYKLTFTTNKAYEFIKLPVNVSDSVIDPDKPIIYLASSNEKKLYAVNYVNGAVTVLELNSIPDKIELGKGQFNNELYVILRSIGSQGTMAIIDKAAFKIKEIKELNVDPLFITADEFGYLYITARGSNGNANLNSYARTTMQLKSTVPVDYYTESIYNPALKRIYSVKAKPDGTRILTSFNVENGVISNAFEYPHNPTNRLAPELHFDINNKYLFNGVENGEILLLNSDVSKDMHSLGSFGVGFSAIAFKEDMSKIFTIPTNTNYVYEYDEDFQPVKVHKLKTGTKSMFYRNNQIIAVVGSESNADYLTGIQILDLSNSESGGDQGANISEELMEDTAPFGINPSVVKESNMVKLSFSINDSIIDPDKPVIYFTNRKEKRLYALNYSTGELAYITFKFFPKNLEIGKGSNSSELYVALSPQEYYYYNNVIGKLAIIDRETFTIKDKIDLAIDPYDVEVVSNGKIYISSSPELGGTIDIYDEISKQAIDRTVVSGRAILNAHPVENKIYVTNTGYNPNLSAYPTRDGKFTDAKYLMPQTAALNAKSVVSPDGRLLINGSGNVFSSAEQREQDMRFINNLDTTFVDGIFESDSSKFFTVNESEVNVYHTQELGLLSTIKLLNKGKAIYKNNDGLIVVSEPTVATNYKTSIEILGDYQGPSTIPPVVTGTKVNDESQITVYFDKPIMTGDDYADIQLLDSQNQQQTITRSIEGNKLIIQPSQSLASNQGYQIKIPSKGLTNLDKANLVKDYEFSFSNNVSYQPNEISLPFLDNGAVVNSLEDRIYLINRAEKKLYIINYVTGKTTQLSFPYLPDRLELGKGPNANELYVSLLYKKHGEALTTDKQQGQIAVINTESLDLKEMIKVKIDPFNLLATRDGYIYMSSANYYWKKVLSLNRNTKEQTEIISLKATMDPLPLLTHYSMILHPTLNRIYMINDKAASPFYENNNFLFGQNILNGSFDGPLIHSGYQPPWLDSNIAISPNGKLLFSGGGVSYTLPTTNENMIYVNKYLPKYTNIAFEGDSTKFYTVQQDSDDLKIYDISNYTLLKSLKLSGTGRNVFRINQGLLVITSTQNQSIKITIINNNLLN